MSWKPPRRFWTEVGIRAEPGGFAVLLDTRPLQTPAKALLRVPTPALAAAIAAEWQAIEAEIDPERLPLTRAANTAIDRVSRDPAPVVEALAAYGNADLICYRADGPEALRRRQAAAWDPWLAWAAERLAAPLSTTTGVMPLSQPAASLAALRAAVADFDPFSLVAVHDLVTLSGSLVLGLAVAQGALPGSEAWALSRLDEIWQAEQWGADDEAEAAAAIRARAFLGAETLLALLRSSESLG